MCVRRVGSPADVTTDAASCGRLNMVNAWLTLIKLRLTISMMYID